MYMFFTIINPLELLQFYFIRGSNYHKSKNIIKLILFIHIEPVADLEVWISILLVGLVATFYTSLVSPPILFQLIFLGLALYAPSLA